MINLNTVTLTSEGSDESRQFTTAILSADGDEVAFMDGHGIVVLTVQRVTSEDGQTSGLAVIASGSRFGCKGGFEVLL